MKILQRLENNKKKVALAGEVTSSQQSQQLQYLDEQTTEALRRMDLEFDQQQMATFRDSQREALLALSVINMDSALLEETSTPAAAEDDELYMEEDGCGRSSLGAWLQCVENVNDAYLTAEERLFHKMRNAFTQESELGSSSEGSYNETNAEGFNMISSHMSKVMTEAFCEHISEFDARELAKRKSVEIKIDENRIRAGIMNEFEKARDDYENALDLAKIRSKAKLDKRRARVPGSDADQHGESKDSPSSPTLTKVSAHFEDVIDSFLDDPISHFSVPTPLRKSKSKLASLNGQPKLNALVSNRLSSSALPTSPGLALNSTLSSEITVIPAYGEHEVKISGHDDGRFIKGSAANLLDKDRIKAAHEEKEKALVRTVIASCLFSIYIEFCS